MDDADARSLVAAMEALTAAITRDPVRQLANATRTGDEETPPWVAGFLDALRQYRGGGEPPAAPPGGPDLPTSGAGNRGGALQVVIVGHSGNAIPVTVTGGQVDVPERYDSRGRGRQDDVRPVAGARGAVESMGGRVAGDIAGPLVRQFATVLAPLAAFGTILSQAGSGLGVFQSAINVLAATLAPIVLPAFVLLATALVAASDQIQAQILPALASWYKLLMEEGLPIVTKFAKAVGEAAEALAYLTKNTPGQIAEDAKNDPAKAAQRASSILDFSGSNRAINDFLGGFSLPGLLGKAAPHVVEAATGIKLNSEPAGGDVAQAGEAKSPARPGEAPDAKPNANAVVNRALQDVMKSLQMSVGPKASFGSLSEVGKQAQLAALNLDPLEQRAKEATIKALGVLQDIAGKVGAPPSAVHDAKPK